MKTMTIVDWRISRRGRPCLWAACFFFACSPSIPWATAAPNPAESAKEMKKVISLRLVPETSVLHGNRASQQFVALGRLADGEEIDVTGDAHFKIADPALARLDANGRVFGLSDGETKLTAELRGLRSTATLEMRDSLAKKPFSFARDIGGILTRRGCNGSSCHGGVKGQAGFHLSDNAEHPRDDYKWIVEGGVFQVLTAESGGPKKPRVNLENPAQSLLLQKPAMEVVHGGGLRFAKHSEDYEIILNWVRAAVPFGDEGGDDAPKLLRLDVFPKKLFLKPQQKHRVLVTASFSDNTTEDYTHRALYEAGESSVAEVGLDGIVEAKQPGETTILIRTAGQVTSFQVGVIGKPLSSFPSIPVENFIDEHVFSKLRKFNIVPSELSGDGEFLRRVCLDLTGTLPPAERVREFLQDKDPRKRKKLIEILLASPEFVDYWTFRFADLFRVAIFPVGINSKWSQEYWEWIRDGIATEKPFDQIARERIAAQGYSGPSRHYLPHAVIGPAPDMMIEQVRVFFGRRFDCARCHDHPYENWTQDQFWGLTAFYGHVFRTGKSGKDSVVFDYPMGKEIAPDVVGRRELRILHPRTGEEVLPTLLDGRILEHKNQISVRQELAEWMTSHPYFTEATVNRMWSCFFGRGFVNPVDDFRSTNPATHPELLSALAADFANNGYDLKHLMRLIVRSRTYQLSGTPNGTNRADRTHHSHALPRPLDAEVLLDAITQVTGVPEVFTAQGPGAPRGENQMPEGTRAIQLRETDLFRSQFLDVYGRPNRAMVPERDVKPNLAQALHVLVGSTYNEKLWAEGGRVYDLYMGGASDAVIVEELYLAALTRYPTKKERASLSELISASPSRAEALKNLQWGLISSREFAENH